MPKVRSPVAYRMSKIAVNCTICLKSKVNTVKLSEINRENVTWLEKLTKIVPEVEWREIYEICEECVREIDQIWQFRSNCIQLDNQRQLLHNLKFTCFHCDVKFAAKRKLLNHIKIAHLNKQFKCDKCANCYTTVKILKTHEKKCAGNVKRFSCEICNVICQNRKAVIEHCVTVHEMAPKAVKPYQCEKCPSRFATSANITQHRKYHDGSRPNICSFCGKSYITKSDLTVHEYTHLNRRNYKCEECPKAFNTNKNLRSHYLVVHTDATLWKYKCEMCPKRFPLKSGFDEHCKRHLGDKQFTCNLCQKAFISRHELRKHMSFHTNDRPFNCLYCQKGYKEKKTYDLHLARIHNIGECKLAVRTKKFRCDICTNMFYDRHKLERHLQTHSGIKPFECTKCQRKFSDKYYMKQHLKNSHNVL